MFGTILKWFGWGAGGASTRQPGTQSGGPSFYSTAAAAPVTVDSALQLSAVFACIRLIAEAIGSLPINIYKWDKPGQRGTQRTLDEDHPLAKLFAGKVNRWQTRQEFIETAVFQYALLGNNYNIIQRGDTTLTKNAIIGLIPLMSEQMAVDLDETGGIVYTYRDGLNVKVYSQETIWHNKLFGNGIIGLSPLGYARNTVGIATATENAVSKVYGNGGKPSGLLTIDKTLTDEQRNRIKANFAELTEGENDRLFVLEAGMAYNKVSLSPQDIELLASRRFNTEDIARFFNVPSVLINDTQSTTAWGSGVQQIIEGFYKFGLRPYCERLQASMEAWLLSPQDRLSYDIEFDLEALLRPSFADRVKIGKEAVSGSLMMPNEWRGKEGFGPVTGGDQLFMQQQNFTLAALADPNRTVDGNKGNADV